MSRWLVLIGMSALSVADAMAAEVTPLRGEQLGVAIKSLAFPQSLRKDLTSGLTNRLLIRVTLLAESKPVGERMVEIAVKYDLWDEKFTATTVSGASTAAAVLSNVEEALAMLGDIKVQNLFSSGEFQGGATLSMRVDVLLNPIEKERMERIRQWVKENSSYTPAGRVGAGATNTPATTGANALFNRIFEQYSMGTDLAAAWGETVASQPFVPDSLP